MQNRGKEKSVFLTNKTILTFDPIKEKDVMEKFMKDNDMTEWREYPSTVGITFVREIRLSLGYGRGEEDGAD